MNTAATLWCSAAVGCQAAGGHVIPALALTAIVLSIHTVLRPLGRLVDKIPAVRSESVGAYTVQLTVDRSDEPQVRARVLEALARSDVTVRGVAGRTMETDSEHTVQLRVDIEVEGKPDALLDELVGRFSLAPGVDAVSWQAVESDTYDDEQLPRWRWLRRRRSGQE